MDHAGIFPRIIFVILLQLSSTLAMGRRPNLLLFTTLKIPLCRFCSLYVSECTYCQNHYYLNAASKPILSPSHSIPFIQAISSELTQHSLKFIWCFDLCLKKLALHP